MTHIRRIGIPATGIALILMAFGTTPVLAATGTALSKEARVSMKQARAAALKVYPGKIVKEELEREPGGSGLRYSFDIRRGRVVHEVGIDARSGGVLENSTEGSKPD